MSKPCDCEDNTCRHVPSKCGDVATSRLVAFGFATYRCEPCAEGLRLSGEVESDQAIPDNPAVFEDEAAALDALEEPCPNCEDKGVVDVDLGGGDTGTALCGVCDGAHVDLDPPRNACEAGACGHDGC